MPSGIYQITNQINGNRYIGSAVNLQRRWREHLSRLRRRQHSNEHLQRAFEKYGESAFTYSVLEQTEKVSQLVRREQHFLDRLKPEYNIAPMAGNLVGVRRSPETCRKLSEWWTPERRQRQGDRMRESRTGKPLSRETRKRLSEAWTPEARQTQSEKMRGNRLAKGKPRSSKTRVKMSVAQMGHLVSAETRKKLSKALKAYWHRQRSIASGMSR